MAQRDGHETGHNTYKNRPNQSESLINKKSDYQNGEFSSSL